MTYLQYEMKMRTKKTYSSFGNNLKRLRFSKGFTQSDVAKRAGELSQSAVTQIENGQKDPSLKTILKLAKALDVPPSKLIDLDNWTTINTSDFGKANSIDELDPIALRNAMALIKHLKRLGIL